MGWLERIISRFRTPSERCPLCRSDDIEEGFCRACGFEPSWLDDPERSRRVAQVGRIDEVVAQLDGGRGVEAARELLRAHPELIALVHGPKGDPAALFEDEGHWEIRERWGIEAASVPIRYARVLRRTRAAVVSGLRLEVGPSAHYDVPRAKR